MAERQGYDYSLLFIVLFLLAFGLVLLFSTSSYLGAVEHGDSAYFLKRQLRFTGLGLALMAVITIIPYRFWRFACIPAFLAAIGLIILIIPYGDEVNGAKRWLVFHGVSIQPSEAAKVAIIILTAFIIEMIGRRRLQTLWGFLLPMVPAAIIAVMLLRITNNLSSALIILAIAFGMLFVACPDYKRFIALAVLAVAGTAGVVTYIVRMADSNPLGFRGAASWCGWIPRPMRATPASRHFRPSMPSDRAACSERDWARVCRRSWSPRRRMI
jgi:cell division protein FtsW